MRLIANIIWFIFGGFIASLLWFLTGFLLSITVIGIPLGAQAFKFSKLMLFPFGKDVKTDFDDHPIANLLWIIFFGWEMAIGYVALGVAYSITIIGIPFGIQWFKLAILALIPFGAKVR